ncbi:MAG TPA: helix-turn-helix domain-containing protein [Chloroflexota bacterium]|nr:helix-turn-helix domain-containing protein [Chloroflexota bacterium]
MVGITVEEAREAALPAGTVVLGGESGLSRSVTGTATLRARTPAFPALHGGELALVPLPLWRQLEPRPRLERLVAQLADAGVAAIVFLDTTPADRHSLEQAAPAADEHALPVLATPPLHTAEMVDVALHRHLAGRREALLHRSQELQREFTALAFAGHGLPAIVKRLAAITGLPAAWEDASLELQDWSLPPQESSSPRLPTAPAGLPVDLPTLLRGARLPLLRWAKALRPDSMPDVASLPLRADHSPEMSPWKRLVVSFMTGGELAGFLSLIGHTGTPDQEARLALAGAALAASIEAWRVRAVTEAQGSATASLVRDWLTGRFDHPGELASRASQLGHIPSPPYGVLVLEAEEPLAEESLRHLAQTMRAPAGAESQGSLTGRATPAGSQAVPHLGSLAQRARPERGPQSLPAPPPPKGQHQANGKVERLNGVLAGSSLGAAGASINLAPGSGSTSLVATSGPAGQGSEGAGPMLSASIDERRLAILVPAISIAAVEQAAATMHTKLESLAAEGSLSGPIFGGIGRPATHVEDVPRAYRQASQALAVARRLGGLHRVAYFGTLGVYRLLAAVSPTEELRSFYQETLGPLLAHDQKNGGELLRTLDAYVACGGSPLDAAQRLHTHRNTVLYRLDKIAELLAVDVRHPEQRLLLHLALRAGEVLGEPQG